jgi:hypothetical protein
MLGLIKISQIIVLACIENSIQLSVSDGRRKTIVLLHEKNRFLALLYLGARLHFCNHQKYQIILRFNMVNY